MTSQTSTGRPTLSERARVAYEDGGASAVYDLARREGVADWRYCGDCDAETPFDTSDPENDECLCCGRLYEPRKGA